LTAHLRFFVQQAHARLRLFPTVRVDIIDSFVISMAHLLIVDDSPTIRRMVRVALAPLGMDVIEAASGLEAIEQLAVAPITLMVLDLNMPDMHGLEVLGFVRANQKFQQLPILVLTTRDDAATRAAAMQSGATSYLTKPFTPPSLLAEARGLIERAVERAG
jgi:two-component system, chemotaxis family, chemotaxis protein CheY